VGIDLSRAFPKPLTDQAVRAADMVVTMGCGDACPIYPGKRYGDWQLQDPASQPVEVVRGIRDETTAASGSSSPNSTQHPASPGYCGPDARPRPAQPATSTALRRV
jgi:hypothetical protein